MAGSQLSIYLGTNGGTMFKSVASTSMKIGRASTRGWLLRPSISRQKCRHCLPALGSLQEIKLGQLYSGSLLQSFPSQEHGISRHQALHCRVYGCYGATFVIASIGKDCWRRGAVRDEMLRGWYFISSAAAAPAKHLASGSIRPDQLAGRWFGRTIKHRSAPCPVYVATAGLPPFWRNEVAAKLVLQSLWNSRCRL
jgi:hypothetical protein